MFQCSQMMKKIPYIPLWLFLTILRYKAVYNVHFFGYAASSSRRWCHNIYWGWRLAGEDSHSCATGRHRELAGLMLPRHLDPSAGVIPTGHVVCRDPDSPDKWGLTLLQSNPICRRVHSDCDKADHSQRRGIRVWSETGKGRGWQVVLLFGWYLSFLQDPMENNTGTLTFLWLVSAATSSERWLSWCVIIVPPNARICGRFGMQWKTCLTTCAG